MYAADKGHPDCVRALLAHGCNVDAVNDRGNTALICATGAKNHECVRLLMRQGNADASIGSSMHAGKTPLEYAISLNADAATIRVLRRVCAVCGKTPQGPKGKFNKCSACEAAHYCSGECQIADWPKHEGECEQMAADREAAEAAAEAKETEAAAAAAKPRCLTCSKTTGAGGGELSTCSRCNTARYCSRECQVKDFPRHKQADGCKK
jgi:hypothetical protein